MKRIVWFFIVLVIATVAGCSTPSNDVYYVMFDNMPNIFDKSVYFNGMEIGEITAQEAGENNIYQVTVTLQGENRNLIKNNVVFYLSAGRLEYATLGNFGEPAPYETKILGFASKGSLVLFKVKTILGQSSLTAAKKANQLYETGWHLN